MNTAAATSRLIVAAAASVPGSPAISMSTKPASSTPAAAPRLFAKYNREIVRPACAEARRNAPAVIKGKVAPRSTDCGRMSNAAMSHFTSVCIGPGPSAGKSES